MWKRIARLTKATHWMWVLSIRETSLNRGGAGNTLGILILDIYFEVWDDYMSSHYQKSKWRVLPFKKSLEHFMITYQQCSGDLRATPGNTWLTEPDNLVLWWVGGACGYLQCWGSSGPHPAVLRCRVPCGDQSQVTVYAGHVSFDHRTAFPVQTVPFYQNVMFWMFGRWTQF